MYTYHFVKITHIRSNFGFLFQNRTKPTPRELVLIIFFILTEKLCELKCVVVNYAILVITTTNYVNNSTSMFVKKNKIELNIHVNEKKLKFV
jgi:hypothetical protein